MPAAEREPRALSLSEDVDIFAIVALVRRCVARCSGCPADDS